MDTLSRPTPLDLRAISESIVHILPFKEDNNDVEFMVVITPNVPVVLLLDETYIHRILMNLLSNAFKFTNSGYVMLIIEYKGNDLIVQVKDTGTGIPDIFLPRLFQPFSQAPTRGSQRGTGLGLSIIKELLHKMDGNITVDSHYSEGYNSNIRTGTTFTVTMPAQSPSPELSSPEAPTSTVVVFPQKDPISQEGQIAAWEHLGYKVVNAKLLSDLRNYPKFKYIWADAEYLQHNLDCLEALLSQDTWTVLVPYSNQEILCSLPGVMSTSRFVLLPKPLMWHTFQARIALARCSSPDVLHSSETTSKLCLLDIPPAQATLRNDTKKEVRILLVEDNPVRLFPLTKLPTYELTIPVYRSTKNWG
jgi:hypothetical protein